MSSLFGIGGGGNVGSAGGSFYSTTIDQSLRLNDDDNAYLKRDITTTSNRRQWTWSGWVKRSNLGVGDQTLFTDGKSSDYTTLNFNSSNQLYAQVNSGSSKVKLTTQVFRDTSAFYHFVWAIDTEASADADRAKLYVNGELITDYSTEQYITINTDTTINLSGNDHQIGGYSGGTSRNFDGYIAEVNFIDGQALDPTSFGESVNGVWRPIAYSGSYGTNGFYLTFEGTGTATTAQTTTAQTNIGDDQSGAGNNFAVSGFAASDVVSDSPTNNHCVLNPLDAYNSGLRLSDGGLKYTGDSVNGAHCGTHSFDIANEKFYWEVTTAATSTWIGIVSEDFSGAQKSGNVYASAGLHVIATSSGNKSQNPYSSSTAYGSSMGAGDVLGIACGDGKIEFFNNGVSQGDAYTGLTGRYKPFAMAPGSGVVVFNFGQTSFSYTAPTDYLSLNSENMPEPAIGPNSDTTSDQHFNTVVYTGNGSTQSITGVKFQPDWVWIKQRTDATSNQLFDVIRGVTKGLKSDDTGAEYTNTNTLTSFDSDGFTVGTANAVNGSSDSLVSWNWKAGGSSNTFNIDGTGYSTASAAGLDGGDITPTGASINTKNGFGILTYTGNGLTNQTMKHGLSQAPQLTIVKDRDTNTNNNQWWASSTIVGDDYFYFSSTAAATGTAVTYPTSGDDTTLTIQRNTPVANNNESGDRFLMYNFHSVEGFSKVGKYVGNGVADGPFVFTGFRPAWVMVKNINNAATNWWIMDTDRSTFNVMNDFLFPNTSGAESASTVLFADFLSNGFKIRNGTYGETNASGNNYIYLALAEAPFKYANAR